MSAVDSIKAYITSAIANAKAYVLANVKQWGIGAAGTVAIQFVFNHIDYVLGVIKAVL